MFKFAYLLFHFVIISALYISKKVYPKMLLLNKLEIKSYLPVSLFFIVWDYIVTDIWWSFNTAYIYFSGWLKYLKIPIEEIAFFFVIPYALLVFIKNLFVVSKMTQITFDKRFFDFLQVAVKFLLLSFAYYFFNTGLWYSFTVCFLLFFTPFSLLQYKIYTIGLVFTLFMTLVFNYYLTYLPIVMYTQAYKTGLQVGTVPIEDFGYAVILYIWIVKGFHATTDTKVFKVQKKD